MKKLNQREKIVLMSILLPLLFVTQYYIFKFGIISPMIKGVNISEKKTLILQVGLSMNIMPSVQRFMRIPQVFGLRYLKSLLTDICAEY